MHSHVEKRIMLQSRNRIGILLYFQNKNILNDYKNIPALAIWVLLTFMVTNHHEKLTAEIKFGILQNWKEMNH